MEDFTSVHNLLMRLNWSKEVCGFPPSMKNKVLRLEEELRFLRTSFICFGPSKGMISELTSLMCNMDGALHLAHMDVSNVFDLMNEYNSGKELYHTICSMIEKARSCETEIREAYSIFLKQSWQHDNPLDPKSLLRLVDSLVENLTDLIDYYHLTDSVRDKIRVLKKKMSFLRNFLGNITTKQRIPHQIKQSFIRYVHFSAASAAYLSYLCWAPGEGAELVAGMDNKLSDLLQKIMPDTSEVIEMYAGLLKALKAVDSYDEKTDEVASFVKFLLEYSVSFVNGEVTSIQEEFIFLVTFLIDLQDECTGDLTQISADIKAIAREAGSLEYKIPYDKAEVNQIKNIKGVVSKLLEKMKLIKAEIFVIELLQSNESFLVLMKDAIGALHEGLKFLKAILFDPPLERELFLDHVETVLSEVTSFIFSNHHNNKTQEMVTKMNLQLIWLLEKIKLIKAENHLNEAQNSDVNSVVLVKDQSEILYEGLRSFREFLKYTSGIEENTEDGELFLTYLEAAAGELLPLNFSTHVNKITEDLVKSFASLNCSIDGSITQKDKAIKMYLFSSELLQMFRLLKAQIRQIHFQDAKPLQSNLPRTDDLGFITSLLQNLRELLNPDANNSFSFVKHHLEMVHLELYFLQSFLIKSEKQRNEHVELKDLWTCIVTVAYEAEHVIDSFVVRNGPLCYRVLWLSAVVEEFKIIKAKVMEIYYEKKFYMEADNVAKASGQLSSQASTLVLDEVVIGFKNEMKEIIELLTRGTAQMDIVSIAGMPGLGKTTLAKKVYNTPSVTSYFHVRSWCCVSQVYQRRQLLLDILGHITEITDMIRRMDADDIAKKLYQCLKRRRYLIIMDDLWDIGAWNDLKESFPNDNNGSRVLFTSRQQDLGSQAKEDCKTCLLHPLSDDESWELLQNKLFNVPNCPPTLCQVGKRIAESCRGLPLSLVVIAGLLSRTETTLDAWTKVSDKLSSHVAADPEGGCMHILELSYDKLPDHLKSCFLYFGAFPEDTEIPIWKLSCLWNAEGFLQNISKTMEDAAEDCLLDLLYRSLVIVAKRRSNGKVRSCRVHDLLWELCQKKSDEENFLRLMHGNDELFATSPEGLGYIAADYNYSSYSLEFQERRLCICSKQKHFTMLRPSGPQVRCLLFSPSNEVDRRSAYDISFIFHNFKLVRVLDLESINMGSSFPAGLELLVQLKYLAVRGAIKSVPSSIAKLWNLEIFLLKGLRGEVSLSDFIWTMKRLRHVHINDHVAFSLQIDKFESSSLLENMDTLSTPALFYGRDTENILRRLPRLRKLRCIFVEPSDYDRNSNKFPILDFLTHLESLKIFYHGRFNPHCEFNFPSNLKKLTLSRFRLPWNKMSVIGRLPNLEVLKLLFKAFEGGIWEMREGEFQNLKYLKLDNLEIAHWEASSDHLPCLEQLILQRCKKLKEVPSTIGDINTLEIIEVHWCSQSAAVSVKQIQYEQQDLKVFISGMKQ